MSKLLTVHLVNCQDYLAVLFRELSDWLGLIVNQRPRWTRFKIPGKENPSVLWNFGNKCIHHRPAKRFCVNCCKMRLWQQLSQHLARLTCIHKIINDEPAFSITCHFGGFHHLNFPSFLRLIWRKTGCLYEPNF